MARGEHQRRLEVGVQDPVVSLGGAALLDAADENFVVHATHALAGRAGVRLRREPHLVLVDSGIASDTFNVACRFRLSSASARTRAREALEFFGQGGRPFTFWLLPGYSPSELPFVLEDAGLVAVGIEAAMALDLSRVGRYAPVEGLEIRRVTGRDDLRWFADITSANSTPPDPYVGAYYDLTQHAFLDGASPPRLYLGCLEGRPVATAELTIAGGVAGLYNVSTLGAFRGRGVGSALTDHCLSEAQRLRLSTAVLQASLEGEPVYRRLGFVATGTVTEFKPGEARRVSA